FTHRFVKLDIAQVALNVAQLTLNSALLFSNTISVTALLLYLLGHILRRLGQTFNFVGVDFKLKITVRQWRYRRNRCHRGNTRTAKMKHMAAATHSISLKQ